VVAGSVLATNERKIKLLLLYCTSHNLLLFCTAGQTIICAGRVHRVSEMVQSLDARIPQQEEVKGVTSCMLITSRYNYLLHILSDIIWGFSQYIENCQPCWKNPLKMAERSRQIVGNTVYDEE
jgi:hypothetical protein